MKCNKCGSEIDDKLLICPECGNILKQEEKGYHHNYATKSLELGAAKLTEEEIDPEYDLNKVKINSTKKLINNPLLIITNILVFTLEFIALILFNRYMTSIEFTWFIKDYHIVILMLFIILTFVPTEFLLYKGYQNPYHGLVPLYRIYVLSKIANDRSKENLKKFKNIVIAYVVWYLLSLSPMYDFWFIFYNEALIIITIVSIIVLIRLRIEILGDLSLRFSDNKTYRILTIIVPYIMIFRYAFDSKFIYTKLEDSYL